MRTNSSNPYRDAPKKVVRSDLHIFLPGRTDPVVFRDTEESDINPIQKATEERNKMVARDTHPHRDAPKKVYKEDLWVFLDKKDVEPIVIPSSEWNRWTVEDGYLKILKDKKKADDTTVERVTYWFKEWSYVKRVGKESFEE